MPEVIGPVRPKIAGAFKVVETDDLGGSFVKSISGDGEVTAQAADGSVLPTYTPTVPATDQTARDSATAAQTDIDEHEANHPGGVGGLDQTARDAALIPRQHKSK